MSPRHARSLLLISALTLMASPTAQACAVCFGRTDSPLGKGLHWGVLALLICVSMMLAVFGAFAVYLVRRSAAVAAEEESAAREIGTPKAAEEA